MASARKLPPAVSHLVQLRHPLPNKESQLQLSGLAEMARRMAADQADGLDDFLNGNGLCAFDGNTPRHPPSSPSAPSQCRCMRCGFHITAAYTSLVHRCPKCNVVICHHC